MQPPLEKPSTLPAHHSHITVSSKPLALLVPLRPKFHRTFFTSPTPQPLAPVELSAYDQLQFLFLGLS